MLSASIPSLLAFTVELLNYYLKSPTKLNPSCCGEIQTSHWKNHAEKEPIDVRYPDIPPRPQLVCLPSRGHTKYKANSALLTQKIMRHDNILFEATNFGSSLLHSLLITFLVATINSSDQSNLQGSLFRLTF